MGTILIAGASGFVGRKTARTFLTKGHRVIGLGTSTVHPYTDEYEHFTWVRANTASKGPWQKEVGKADVIINLAGRTIFKRWTPNYKQAIYDSRIKTTQNLVSAIETGKNQLLLSTSAVGFYGDCGNTKLTEDHKPGSKFLSALCVDWENEADKARAKGVRVAKMRFGVVLDQGGGALSTMTPAFKMGAGGPLGSGKQWFPWIYMDDLQHAMLHLMENSKLDGPFNFTAPGVVIQKEFARQLGRVLGRPAFIPTPGFAVRLVMGDVADVLLESQRAIPQRLLDSGYRFLYPDIQATLKNIFNN